MKYELIKDNFPELAKENNKILNYAVCQNDELFASLLTDKLVTVTNQFLTRGTLADLDEITNVVDAIYREFFDKKLSDEVKEARAKTEKVEEYTKHYIGFFPEQAPTAEQAPAEAPQAQEEEPLKEEN